MNDGFLYLLAQFDGKTQARLSGYYDILHQNGFVGNQTKNIPYHFTLSKKSIDSEKQLLDDLDEICAGTDCIDIHLSHIGLFSGSGIIFIAPDMNFEMLKLQQKFYPNCRNGAYHWTAHTTLLIDEPENVMKALPIVVNSFKPFIARIESLGLYEFSPMRFIKEFLLKSIISRRVDNDY